MTWFERLTGISEQTPAHVREQLRVENDTLVCPDGRQIVCGHLETPSLHELRESGGRQKTVSGPIRVRQVVGDVQQLHCDSSNSGALFQVASQFNLLEMASPHATPERGVGIYESDRTQGPACAIACGGGTIYRNYFAPVGQGADAAVGQSANQQIDCSLDLGTRFDNADNQLWRMENGYLFPTNDGLEKISLLLQSATEAEYRHLQGLLRIGLQLDAAVTLKGCDHLVSQAYCSALPVAYGNQASHRWTDFAKLILESAYEATLWAAIENRARTGSDRVYLTLLGGGVFGNDDQWIIGAIDRAIKMFNDSDLDVAIVSYGAPKPIVSELVNKHAADS
ncbi:MAG: hypothetical protein WBD20_06975 [Pirellulaceae bacterium]